MRILFIFLFSLLITACNHVSDVVPSEFTKEQWCTIQAQRPYLIEVIKWVNADPARIEAKNRLQKLYSHQTEGENAIEAYEIANTCLVYHTDFVNFGKNKKGN